MISRARFDYCNSLSTRTNTTEDWTSPTPLDARHTYVPSSSNCTSFTVIRPAPPNTQHLMTLLNPTHFLLYNKDTITRFKNIFATFLLTETASKQQLVLLLNFTSIN